jgi:hypothetical protein
MGKPSLIQAHLDPGIDNSPDLHTVEPRIAALVVSDSASPVAIPARPLNGPAQAWSRLVLEILEHETYSLSKDSNVASLGFYTRIERRLDQWRDHWIENQCACCLVGTFSS